MKVWVASNLSTRRMAIQAERIGYKVDDWNLEGGIAHISVADAKEAKELIEKLTEHLLPIVEWDAFGALDNDGDEWYCSECFEDILSCECES